MVRPLGRPWFKAKAHGYGAGWPIAWQGWVAVAVFLVATVWLAAQMRDDWRYGIAQAAVVAAFVWLAAVKTEGGWRWRG